MNTPTTRQLTAWPQYVAEAQKYVDTSTLPSSLSDWEWKVLWAEEVHPGRGASLSALYLDGEYVVQISLDVYGQGFVSVGETFWVHSSADESCLCEYCEEDRERGE